MIQCQLPNLLIHSTPTTCSSFPILLTQRNQEFAGPSLSSFPLYRTPLTSAIPLTEKLAHAIRVKAWNHIICAESKRYFLVAQAGLFQSPSQLNWSVLFFQFSEVSKLFYPFLSPHFFKAVEYSKICSSSIFRSEISLIKKHAKSNSLVVMEVIRIQKTVHDADVLKD